SLGSNRELNLEIEGYNLSSSTTWIKPQVYLAHPFIDKLAGHERWYELREEFYSSSCFNRPQGDDKSLYSGYDNGYIKGAIEAAAAFVGAVLKYIEFKSSMEFGCSIGAIVYQLRKKGVEAYGTDLSIYAIETAIEKAKPYLRVAKVEDVIKEGHTYEAVYGIEVFEHLLPQDIPSVFSKIRSLCSKWFFFTVPCNPRFESICQTSFKNLPKDHDGKPIQGHTVDASWYWWARQVVQAGFELDLPHILKIRKVWGPNSKWWNLFVCKPAEANSINDQQQRLDAALLPSFESLRQSLSAEYINTGRKITDDSGQVRIRTEPGNLPAYIYYGPYLTCAGPTKIDFTIASELPDVLSGDTILVEVTIKSNKGILVSQSLKVNDFKTSMERNLHLSYCLETTDDHGLQLLIYWTGFAAVELLWPPAVYTVG
ncbi:MAG: class I SAM-dependent methyltransferase, partial [Desulfobacteraceae bacterium]|nr:class I SAM-dependent methyltransferase [Desulfobacteraceae bacterium]